jgi:hypothetical protein
MLILGIVVLSAALLALVSAAVVKVGIRAYFREKRAYLQALLKPDDQD